MYAHILDSNFVIVQRYFKSLQTLVPFPYKQFAIVNQVRHKLWILAKWQFKGTSTTNLQ